MTKKGSKFRRFPQIIFRVFQDFVKWPKSRKMEFLIKNDEFRKKKPKKRGKLLSFKFVEIFENETETGFFERCENFGKKAQGVAIDIFGRYHLFVIFFGGLGNLKNRNFWSKIIEIDEKSPKKEGTVLGVFKTQKNRVRKKVVFKSVILTRFLSYF